MKTFTDKVAVITGAASGIGRALAFQAAAEGMRLVLADVEIGALEETAEELSAQRVEVLPIPTDITQPEQVHALALLATQAFGEVHLLCNHAGSIAQASIWEDAPPDWQWILKASLWGVINSLQIFAPLMVAQTSESHILNTTNYSLSTNSPEFDDQEAGLRAVINISKSFYYDLKKHNSKVGLSVLCPAWAVTSDPDKEVDIPANLLPTSFPHQPTPADEVQPLAMLEVSPDDRDPASIAARIFDAIRHDQFYIITHP